MMEVYNHASKELHMVELENGMVTELPSLENGRDITNLTCYHEFPEYKAALSIYRYAGPSLFFLAIIGNALAVLVFSQKSLRASLTSQLYMILAIVDGSAVFFVNVFSLPDFLDLMTSR